MAAVAFDQQLVFHLTKRRFKRQAGRQGDMAQGAGSRICIRRGGRALFSFREFFRQRGGHIVGKVGRKDLRVLADDDKPFDQVFQFAGISGPAVAQEDIQYGFRQSAPALVFFIEAVQEIDGHRYDLFVALAQRRDADLEDAEAVVEVFAEFFFVNELVDVLVGRRDDPALHLLPPILK